MTETDEDFISEITSKIRQAQKVDFEPIIGQIRQLRDILVKEDKYVITAEYCYQLISLLMESEKVINGGFFSTDYIDEKTDTLARLSHSIRREVNGEWIPRGVEEWS